MKKIFYLFGLFLLLPLGVFATDSSTPVGNDIGYNACLNFQDAAVYSGTSGYFGHCKKATCSTGTWATSYLYSNRMVNCSNGNKNYYIKVINDGCQQYNGACTPTFETKYCSAVTFYDCSKTADGSTYVPPKTTTPTTTKKPTSPKTTSKKKTTSPTTTTAVPPTTTETPTTTTTEPPIVLDDNCYLKSIKLSEGEINFDKDELSYEILVEHDTTYIEVEAEAESTKATVEIDNNDQISENIPIIISVTSESGDMRAYSIYIKFKDKPLSSNNLIRKLDVLGYDLDFRSDVNDYNLKIGKKVKALDITVELRDENASYVIYDNDNLKDKDVIKIQVTAEDGGINTYTITVAKKTGPSVAVIILLILLFGIIAVVAYKLIKRLMPAKKDEDYDYE